MPKPAPTPAIGANVDLHLVQVLHTVIAERSVSRAALRLQASQPLVSAQLKRLRALTGDPLLVRAGRGLAPTPAALAMLEPAERLLTEAERLFSPRQRRLPFEPRTSTLTVRLAASDYLDPSFLPAVVARLQREAPGLVVEMVPLSADLDFSRKLELGEVDLVVGNWLHPPAELHLGRLTSDEVVCLVAPGHPAVRQPRAWTRERYLASAHVAPSALTAGSPGVIDEHLQGLGLARRIAVRAAHFSLIPAMVARTQLVLTTGRQFCTRVAADHGLRIVPCPVAFPPMAYYQLWHARTHQAPALRWLREQVRDVARGLAREVAA
ncbi:MAG: LysR family transcriptional regulator [Rubrivivax sp.]